MSERCCDTSTAPFQAGLLGCVFFFTFAAYDTIQVGRSVGRSVGQSGVYLFFLLCLFSLLTRLVRWSSSSTSTSLYLAATRPTRFDPIAGLRQENVPRRPRHRPDDGHLCRLCASSQQ